MSFDDLYNNFKIVKQEVKGTTSSSLSSSSQNLAFMSSTSSTNEVNTAYGVSTAMLSIDGAGLDWSFMTDEEVPTDMALMAFSDSETATVKTVDNGEQEITATIDGKEFTITEASVRRHLQLANIDEVFSGEHTPYVTKNDTNFKHEEGEGSDIPPEPQPPPSTAQPTNEEPIPNVVSSSHQKTQTPRKALNQVTELPQTSEPIPNVPDEAVYEEWDDRVERATTTASKT
ncbi:ribonuclease H-like domain-containing protein [Tanacetum coccineum]